MTVPHRLRLPTGSIDALVRREKAPSCPNGPDLSFLIAIQNASAPNYWARTVQSGHYELAHKFHALSSELASNVAI